MRCSVAQGRDDMGKPDRTGGVRTGLGRLRYFSQRDT